MLQDYSPHAKALGNYNDYINHHNYEHVPPLRCMCTSMWTCTTSQVHVHFHVDVYHLSGACALPCGRAPPLRYMCTSMWRDYHAPHTASHGTPPHMGLPRTPHSLTWHTTSHGTTTHPTQPHMGLHVEVEIIAAGQFLFYSCDKGVTYVYRA